MKKAHLAGLGLLAGLLIIAVGAQAEESRRSGATSGGGFIGPGPVTITVREAVKRPDDAQVVLEGYIVKSLGGEHYEFKDDTGVVTVEIDAYLWQGRQVSPGVKVRLEGEVERNRSKVLKIDVEQLTVL